MDMNYTRVICGIEGCDGTLGPTNHPEVRECDTCGFWHDEDVCSDCFGTDDVHTDDCPTRAQHIARDMADVQRRMASCVTYVGRVSFGQVVLNISLS